MYTHSVTISLCRHLRAIGRIWKGRCFLSGSYNLCISIRANILRRQSSGFPFPIPYWPCWLKFSKSPSPLDLGDNSRNCLGLTGQESNQCCVDFGGWFQCLQGQTVPVISVLWSSELCGVEQGQRSPLVFPVPSGSQLALLCSHSCNSSPGTAQILF